MRGTAVVTGAEHPTGLGAGRALFEAGAEVVGVTSFASSTPPCTSRVWHQLHRLGRDLPLDWTQALLELGGRLSAPAFLLPTQDPVVAEISRRRAELCGCYRFVLPPDEIVQAFHDKTLFAAWARQFDLPLPATRVVENDAELRAAARDMPCPLVVKPLYRTHAWSRMSPVQKVIRIESAADLDHIPFDLFAAAPKLVVSQWIQGPDDAVHYCLAYCAEPGQLTLSFTGRKLLQFPRQTGSTAICVGTDNGEVREIAAETFRLARFEGMGSVEVKYGPDNRPYITEPTVGRPNLQSASAVRAGCNLQAFAMAHALGLELHPARPIRNCWWMQEDAILELATSRSRHPIPWRLLGREAVRAHRVAGAYWAWRDPAPAVSLLGDKSRRVLRRLRRNRR